MILIVTLLLQLVGFGVSIRIRVPASGNCESTTVLECFVDSVSTTHGWQKWSKKGEIMTNGKVVNPNDTGKYSEETMASSFLLKIHNTSIEDEDDYRCKSGFNQSAYARLPFECKASSVVGLVDGGKHLQLQVDKLYPINVTFSVSQSVTAAVLTGSVSCSEQQSYFQCNWTSQQSLPDGYYSYSVTVKTITESSPINGAFRIVRPRSPVISNQTLNGSRTILKAKEDQPFLIECVSSGGIPAPTVAWYKNNQTPPLSSNSSGIKGSDGTYTVALRYYLTPTANDDRSTFTCRSSYPAADIGYQDSRNTSAVLLLTLSPSETIISCVPTKAENDAEIRCITLGSRPETVIQFKYGDVLRNGTFTATLNGITETYKSEAVLSLPVNASDNGKIITCIVQHEALPAVISRDLPLSVLFSAPTSSTKISGNHNIVADGTTTLTLECMTGSSNPPSNITWWANGQTILKSNESYSESIGSYNGKVRSQRLFLTPNRTMDGTDIKCEVSNVISGSSDSTSVSLDLNYSAIIYEMANKTVVKGEYTQLECRAWSKPPSLFNWLNSSSQLLASGYGNKESNRLLYEIPQVQLSHDGVYRCKADNGITPADIKTLVLIVHYPPIITIEYKNASVNDTSITLRCKTVANPSKIRYWRWYREWPGAERKLINSSSGEVLQLVNLTFAYSGLYTCSASNDIIEFSTGEMFTNGSAYLLVKSFPVIVQPNPEGDEPFKVTGRLRKNATFQLDYYSNVEEISTQCLRVVNSSRTYVTCWTIHSHVKVTLPVFSQNVSANGLRDTVSFAIESEDAFGHYNVEIINSFGKAVFPLQIVPSGPPEMPFSIQVYDIGQSTARVSWISGFSGDLNQTIVIQLSRDENNWRNKTQMEVYYNQKESMSLELSYLENSANYFLRMFAFNLEGSSEFSDSINFTTLMQEESTSPQGALIGGVAGGISALIVLAACGVIFILLKRRGYFAKEKDRTKLQSTNTVEEEDSSDDDGMKPNPMYVSAGPMGQMDDKVYAKPAKKKPNDMKSAAIYSEVNKPKQTTKLEVKQKKKGKPLKGKQTQDGDIYENSPAPSAEANTYGNAGFDNTYEMTDKPGNATSGSVNKDGLVYADLEFNPPKAPKGKKPVIHGLDDRTEYVEVDFQKRADPLPDSDTEESRKSSKK